MPSGHVPATRHSRKRSSLDDFSIDEEWSASWCACSHNRFGFWTAREIEGLDEVFHMRFSLAKLIDTSGVSRRVYVVSKNDNLEFGKTLNLAHDFSELFKRLVAAGNPHEMSSQSSSLPAIGDNGPMLRVIPQDEAIVLVEH